MGSRSSHSGIPLADGYIAETDASFASFLASSPSRSDLQRYVFDHYYVVALSHAYQIARVRRWGDSSERDDFALQLAYEVMTAIAAHIHAGSFSYRARGGAPFSMYLLTAVKRAAANPFRIKVPTLFLRQGTVAQEVYRRVFRGHETDQQIRADLYHNQGVPEQESNRILCEVHQHIARQRPIDHVRRNIIPLGDENQLPHMPADSTDETASREVAEALHEAIDRLEPAQKWITEGYYFGSQQLKEMGRKYGIKNPVYEKKKAVDRLRAELLPLLE